MRAMKDSGIEWIGEIPQEWETKKLKYCVDLCLEKTSDKSSSASYIGLEHIASFTGALCEDYEVITDFNGDTLDFHEGNVLFGKLRPYLAKAYQAEYDGRCSSEFWVMDPTGIEGKYLLYYVLSHGFLSDIDHSTFGVKMPRAEWEYAGNEKIPFPSQQEQLHIAEYLDAICAKIDTLITAKEKTNALLKERRQSLIYEAVTKGLDHTVPMKDSGIEWLGEIPEGWDIVALKRLGTPATGSTPSKDNPDYWEGDIPWVSSKDLKSDYLLDSEDHITQKAVEESGLTLFDPGTLVFCVRSGILRHTFPVAVAMLPVTINQDIRALSLTSDVNPAFLLYYMRGMNNTIVSLYQKIGATVESIEMDWFMYFPVVLPSIEEQNTIVEALDTQCAAMDLLVKQNNTTIKQLREYRQSLIYEAVTGKIGA